MGFVWFSQAKPMATTPESWGEAANRELRSSFGLPLTGGFLTGIDLATLPAAFAAGCVVGSGLALWQVHKQPAHCCVCGDHVAGTEIASTLLWV